MRWKGRKQSSNIEDRRHSAGGNGQRRPSSGGMKMGGIGFFIMLLIFLFTGQGQNFMDMMGGEAQPGAGGTSVPNSSNIQPGTDDGREFIAVVLKDTENVWNPIFQNAGGR